MKSQRTQNESLFDAYFGPEAELDHFSLKMSKERLLQSLAIVIGPCWTNFCSQKLKRRTLATFGFNRTELRATQPKLHSMFYAAFEDLIISRWSRRGLVGSVLHFFSAIASQRIIECSFSCVARSAVLLKPNIANCNFDLICEQKFVKHSPITIAIDFSGLSLLIFKEKWSNYASGSKSAPNSDSFWVRRLFNVWVRVFYAPNATIFLVYKLHL